MASNLMIDDRLQIDKFNPTTWTGDFGIPHDGFPKDRTRELSMKSQSITGMTSTRTSSHGTSQGTSISRPSAPTMRLTARSQHVRWSTQTVQ